VIPVISAGCKPPHLPRASIYQHCPQNGHPAMHIDTREYQIIRGERDEALARVAELQDREDTARGELRDLRGAVDRLTGMLSQCLDATRPGRAPGTVHPIRPRRPSE
jgi:hypothetical protein